MKQLSLDLGSLTQDERLDVGGATCANTPAPYLIAPHLDQEGVQIGFEVHVGMMKKKNNEHGGHVKWKLVKVTDTLENAAIIAKRVKHDIR